jgi:hypothetical protein
VVAKHIAAALLVTVLQPVVMGQVAGDWIPHPPERQEFASPSGEFLLTIATTDAWRSVHAQAELFSTTAGTRTRIWQRPLPHRYGPRHVLVGNRGDVLLLDEWIKVMSRHAVMLIDQRNRIVTQRSFKDVETVVGVPLGSIVSEDRSGFWMGGRPTLDAEANRAVVPTVANRNLIVDLQNGRLSVAR